MRHVVVYRGQAPRVNILNMTFDRGVPTPVDAVQYEKLDIANFEDYRPGIQVSKGRPILIKLLHHTRTALWGRQFVQIVRSRFPTCPIVIYGLQPGFDVAYEDIPDTTCLFSPTHTELKKIQPYREYDLTYGEHARIGRRPLTLVAAPYGAQTAIAYNVVYGYDGWQNDIPKAYPPVEEPPTGSYVLVVEYGPNRERSWEGLRDEVLTQLQSSGIPFKSIKSSSPESFRSDWDLIGDAWYCIFCGESDLVYAAALQGKRGVFVTKPDIPGWPLRGQLAGSWFPENGIVEIDGTPPALWAERIIRKAKRLAPGYIPEDEGPEPVSNTVLLNPHTGGINAPADDVERDRTRKTRKSRKNRFHQS